MKVRQRDIEQTKLLQNYVERELRHSDATLYGVVFGLLFSAAIVSVFVLVGVAVRGVML